MGRIPRHPRMNTASECERRARTGWAEAARRALERGEPAAGEAWPSNRFDADQWEWGPVGETPTLVPDEARD